MMLQKGIFKICICINNYLIRNFMNCLELNFLFLNITNCSYGMTKQKSNFTYLHLIYI